MKTTSIISLELPQFMLSQSQKAFESQLFISTWVDSTCCCQITYGVQQQICFKIGKEMDDCFSKYEWQILGGELKNGKFLPSQCACLRRACQMQHDPSISNNVGMLLSVVNSWCITALQKISLTAVRCHMCYSDVYSLLFLSSASLDKALPSFNTFWNAR